ncbi:hypothetical protein QQF64_013282 [Cirrhinus molitorella]|uniref:Uncharacterized protein n=1 Tax=Cirrhinus molitorella TaxID=172907 RepID=A0ABR3LT98_9TELE
MAWVPGGGRKYANALFDGGGPVDSQDKQSLEQHTSQMDLPTPPVSSWLEIDVDLGFALFFLFLLCLFLFVTIVRCAQTVVDPYGAISTSTYQEEQINN